MPMTTGRFTAMILLLLSLSCGKDDEASPISAGHSGPRPEVLPQMTNRDLPFRYPAALYSQKVQGNVTLRIYIDSTGKVTPESTRVVETSGYSALDSAAVKGSRDLNFVAARRRGAPLAVSILFPVYFRHPEAPALPGDTILRRSQPTQ